jgi:hypothetical protein
MASVISNISSAFKKPRLRPWFIPSSPFFAAPEFYGQAAKPVNAARRRPISDAGA